MKSPQEDVLEEFMQKSFGAQNLYVPQIFQKGKGTNYEPADLAWINDEFIALFYMKGTNKNLEKQIHGNKKQAKGYHRLWSTHEPNYALRGINRFGDERCCIYNIEIPLLFILVVSNKCGIQLHDPLPGTRPNAVIVVPEQLINRVAEFAGTMTDLLQICGSYVDSSKGLEISEEDSFTRLLQHIQSYTDNAADRVKNFIIKSGIIDKGVTEFSGVDLAFLYGTICNMKFPDEGQTNRSDKAKRELSAKIFSDLTFYEYAILSIVSQAVLQLSEPPNYSKYGILKINLYNYPFVIYSSNANAVNFEKTINEAMELCKDENGNYVCVSINFCYMNDQYDIRTPLFYTFPDSIRPTIAKKLLEEIINLYKSERN